jgi:arylsulfatase A-like enzyme
LRVRFPILFIASVTLAFACKRSGDADNRKEDSQDARTKEGASSKEGKDTTKEATPPSTRTGLQSYRPLLDEAPRAELEAGGLLVDFGTADQYKFVRGGWRSGWGETKEDPSGFSYAQVTGQTAIIEGLARTGSTELLIRARSAVAGQKLAVWVDGIQAGTAEVGPTWKVVRFPVKNAPAKGRRELLLRFKQSGSPRGDIDWVFLAEKAGAEPPAVVPRVMPLNLGRARRSLVAPTARTYSFYMDVPEKASLVFDYGSSAGANFQVSVEEDGVNPEVVFGPKTAKSWTEAKVDLSKYAGKTVRLALETVGGGEGVSGWGEPEIMVAGSAPPAHKAPPKTAKNAIVLLIDTARADSYAPFWKDKKVVTPTYDAFAKTSTVFVAAYNQENWTKPSVASTLSGVYPSTHNTKLETSKLPDGVKLLPEWLKEHGFRTGAFVANGYISNKFGFEKGWDQFKNYIREEKPSEAEYVFPDALKWIKENKDKGRYFLYIQTIDPHVVYRRNPKYSKLYFKGEYKGFLGPTIEPEEQIAISNKKVAFTERDLDWVRALYWGEVSYHDAQMGYFMEELEKLKVLDDTVFVVTNDHGEELHEHGRLGHGHSLYDELLRAPLLFHFPPVFPSKEVTEVVENLDVVPTLTEVLGVKPLAQAEGHSLLPLVADEPGPRPNYAISEFLDTQRAVHVGRWKFIRTPGNRVNLFDIAADRTEMHDFLASTSTDKKPIARRMCEVHLGEGLASPDKRQRRQNMTVARRSFEAGCADIDPATRKQLAALGYFGGSDPCSAKEKSN